MKQLIVTMGAVVAALATGCPSPGPEEVLVDTSIYAERLGEPAANATAEQVADFEAGLAVATRRFDTNTGLGPNFNVTFCGSCHEKPVFGGSAPRYRDFYLVGSRLPDGSVVHLGMNGVQTRFNTAGGFNLVEPDVNLMARRNAIPFFGVGALAAIDEDAILANIDPEDVDGDGISGRANYDRGFVGRFGRKAQTVSLEGFIRGPLFNHAGITSDPLSQQLKAALPIPSQNEESNALRCVGCQAAAPDEPTVDDDGVPDPELSEDDLFSLVSFVMLMGAPKPDEPNELTRHGERIFEQINCTGCHVPGLKGKNGIVMAYSDLLLHDMGPELADGFTQGLASGSEYRTQPLWGVAATGPYLHDGRADTLDEAIRWHGGEAELSREAYEALSAADRDALIAFLNSLGGARQRSPGLLPPGTPVESAGSFGAPLPGAEPTRFLSGRSMFDRDLRLDDGLGDRFNGDSCRACHFEPGIGGAGPAGLNITRQGIAMADGPHGTLPVDAPLLHRFSAVDFNSRPAPHPEASIFELRQTPALYGIGQIDQIPEMAIVMAEDPEDEDGDGISGRAHRMSNGTIGRFGWKAQLPSVEEFARDALSAENGLTLDEGDFLAGFTSDTDDLPDPEFAGAPFDDLLYYLLQLAPPPRGGTVQEGAQIFGGIGCDGCHTPSLPTGSGEDVFLYSDLLLHDVSPDGFVGIAEGEAEPREFRTPPLWGVGKTAPYMHDGLSPTLDHAIRRHAAESSEVTAAYLSLSDAEREQLLTFLRSL